MMPMDRYNPSRVLPRNLYSASAHAAMLETSKITPSDTTVMIKLFRKNKSNRALENTV